MKKITHSPWNIALIEKGDHYGYENSRVHDKDDPLVLFYDRRQNDQLAGSYYLSTILAIPEYQGLTIDDSVPSWTASDLVIDSIRKAWGPVTNADRYAEAKDQVFDYLYDVEMQSSFEELGVPTDDPKFVDEYVAWLLPERAKDTPHIYGHLLIMKHKGDLAAARAEAKDDAETAAENYSEPIGGYDA